MVKSLFAGKHSRCYLFMMLILEGYDKAGGVGRADWALVPGCVLGARQVGSPVLVQLKREELKQHLRKSWETRGKA